MKRIVLTILMLIAVASLSSTFAARTDKAQREKAVVEFTEAVKLQGVLLRGSYVIVHDEERMAKGEPCSYIYRNESGKEGALVASFHCEHVERAAAKALTIRLSARRGPSGVREFEEFQFAGSTAAHRVPSL